MRCLRGGGALREGRRATRGRLPVTLTRLPARALPQIDHHCPWTGHCIGGRNLLYFKAFVTLIVIQLTWVVVLSVGFSLQAEE